LVRLFDSRLASRLGPQLGRLFAGAATLGYGVAMPFAARAPGGDGSVGVVDSAAVTLSWVVGGAIAVSAAGLGSGDDERAIVQLAHQRGFSSRAIAMAQVAATARRGMRLVGVPALLLSAIALAFAGGLATLGARALLVVGMLGYVSVLSLTLALLVHVARTLHPERGRVTVLALVFLPEIARVLFPQLPGVPSLLGALLDQVLVLGGRW